MNIFRKSNEQGVSILLVVVIIAAASLIMVRTISFLSLGELEMADKLNQGEKNLQLAESCLEEALWEIRQDNDYEVLDRVVSILDESCNISVNQTGQEKNVETKSLGSNYTRNINAKAIVDGDQLVVSFFQIGRSQ